MEEAFKRYQKKKMLSNYQEMYGASLDDKYKYNNILKYKDFDHVSLNYSLFSWNMQVLLKRKIMNTLKAGLKSKKLNSTRNMSLNSSAPSTPPSAPIEPT